MSLRGFRRPEAKQKERKYHHRYQNYNRWIKKRIHAFLYKKLLVFVEAAQLRCHACSRPRRNMTCSFGGYVNWKISALPEKCAVIRKFDGMWLDTELFSNNEWRGVGSWRFLERELP